MIKGQLILEDESFYLMVFLSILCGILFYYWKNNANFFLILCKFLRYFFRMFVYNWKFFEAECVCVLIADMNLTHYHCIVLICQVLPCLWSHCFPNHIKHIWSLTGKSVIRDTCPISLFFKYCWTICVKCKSWLIYRFTSHIIFTDINWTGQGGRRVTAWPFSTPSR
jgi:hypothetical protein